MMPSARLYALALGAVLIPAAAHATKPKLDSASCARLRIEETKFRQSGILNDMGKGAAWAKANLSAARLRDVKRYVELDEQIQFGCRDARMSVDAAKASAAAARIELNSDADPTVPLVKDPAKPGAQPDSKTTQPASKTKKKPAKATHKKQKTGDPKSGSLEQPKGSTASSSETAPQPRAAADSTASSSGSSGDAGPTLPAFGFGETVVLPFSNSD